MALGGKLSPTSYKWSSASALAQPLRLHRLRQRGIDEAADHGVQLVAHRKPFIAALHLVDQQAHGPGCHPGFSVVRACEPQN